MISLAVRGQEYRFMVIHVHIRFTQLKYYFYNANTKRDGKKSKPSDRVRLSATADAKACIGSIIVVYKIIIVIRRRRRQQHFADLAIKHTT